MTQRNKQRLVTIINLSDEEFEAINTLAEIRKKENRPFLFYGEKGAPMTQAQFNAAISKVHRDILGEKGLGVRIMRYSWASWFWNRYTPGPFEQKEHCKRQMHTMDQDQLYRQTENTVKFI